MPPLSELPETDLPLPRGPVLVLAAHPGDELVGCGGTLALHAARGERVQVVIAFDGAGPARRGARESLAARRRTECLAAARHLGLEHYEFWDYPEGREPTPEELFFGARLLAGRLAELAPRTLYVPWAGELGHEQRLLARGTQLALEMGECAPELVGYEVWTPLAARRVVDISDVSEQKRAALAEHRSQPGQRDLVHLGLGLSAQRSRWLPAGARYGEAFAPWVAGAREPLRARRARPGAAA
jgi:LmbE family N-acetylglucosaminyl deacetylase